MDTSDDAKLDALLGCARPVVVSPYFSRRVMREVRLLSATPPERGAFWRWAFGAAFACLSAGFFFSLGVNSMRITNQHEFEVMFDQAAGLDTIIVTDVDIANIYPDL